MEAQPAQRQVSSYLIGAPREWAGFSRTVMVVSVSFSRASASYSGIMGAGEEEPQEVMSPRGSDTGSDVTPRL